MLLGVDNEAMMDHRLLLSPQLHQHSALDGYNTNAAALISHRLAFWLTCSLLHVKLHSGLWGELSTLLAAFALPPESGPTLACSVFRNRSTQRLVLIPSTVL